MKNKAKNVLITCASGQIGTGITSLLSKEYTPILATRSTHSLPENHLRIEADFSQPTVEYPLDLPLHGIILITPKPKTSSLFPENAEWTSLFQDCFIGPLSLIKSAIPKLVIGGRIVIISGISSVQYIPNHTMFGVLRSAWLAQAKSMAFELGAKNICVNSISLGGTLTPSFEKTLTQRAQRNNTSIEEEYQASVSNVPLKKYASLKEITHTVEFLLSEQSDHITGANLLCDGGFTKFY